MYKPPFNRTRLSSEVTVLEFQTGGKHAVIHPKGKQRHYRVRGIQFKTFWDCVEYAARVEGVPVGPPELKGLTACNIADFVSSSHSYFCATCDTYPVLSPGRQYLFIRRQAELTNKSFGAEHSGQLYTYFCFEIGVDDV